MQTQPTNGELKEAILSQLGIGREKALPGPLLARRLGFNDDRIVRQAIRELIADRVPVASAVTKPYGYFIAQTQAEVISYAADLKSRTVENAIRRRDFNRAARSILQPGQLKLL